MENNKRDEKEEELIPTTTTYYIQDPWYLLKKFYNKTQYTSLVDFNETWKEKNGFI